MQNLHFWLHCFALWHISSLVVNKSKQVFTSSPLETYPEQGLEQLQSRTTHLQSQSGRGTCRASPRPGIELCLGGNWNPFRNMARLEKKAPELYSSARHLWLLALHLHLHGRAKHGTHELRALLAYKQGEWGSWLHYIPFSRTVSRDRRTSGLLNEVADLESEFSNTNSPLNLFFLMGREKKDFNLSH